MSPASRLFETTTDGPAPLCARVGAGRRPSRDDRLPLRESAPLVAGMALSLWSVIGALVWSVLR